MKKFYFKTHKTFLTSPTTFSKINRLLPQLNKNVTYEGERQKKVQCKEEEKVGKP